MNKILFRGFDLLRSRGVGYADVLDYSFSCFLKGKDMGYDKVYVVFPKLGNELGEHFERYNITEKEYNWQETNYLPWKWYPRNKEIITSEWDLIIDTTQPNSLYDGFPGIGAGFWNVSQYLSLYHKEKNIFPCLKKMKSDIPYVIFQYRTNFPRGFHSLDRVTSPKEFECIVKIVKKELGNKYEYWKIGDPCHIEEEFDRIVPPMYNNLNDFVELISKCSLIITSHSGPMNIAFIISELPIITISLIPQWYSGNPISWSNHMGKNKKVEKHPNWCDNRLLIFNKGILPDKYKVLNFLKEHNL